MKRSESLGLMLLVAACTGGPPPPTPSPSPNSSASQSPSPHPGGEAIFGAEQWPECINPITSCASAYWTHYTVLEHVLPKAMQLDAGGNFVASPLLAEAPTLENGGLRQNPFTVTYRISPQAAWDDGSPITSNDFRFTWRAVLGTRGAYEKESYEAIRSIDASDPATAVIRFSDTDPDWPDLFGGEEDYVLKAAAFPDFRGPHPNLQDEMQRSIGFSGGPFRLESWDVTKAVLVRNERYFGTKPYLDRVTFVPTTDQPTEIQSLVNGGVDAVFPAMGFSGQTPQDAFGGHRGVRTLTGSGIYLDVLWFNHGEAPLDDPLVREALMYAVDREAILDKVVRPWNPSARVANCGLVALPTVGPWCQTHPFERFTYDPDRARSILAADGYDCSGAICMKDGQPLKIMYRTISTNPRRVTTQQMIVEQARAAGISFEIKNYAPGIFYGYNVATSPLQDFSQPAGGDPSVSEIFSCDEIPQEPLGYGGNFIHWCDREADLVMKAADREPDPAKRLALMGILYEIEARDFVSLPLYALPAVTAWRADRIAGPIGAYNSSPYGAFFNMNEWYEP